MIGGQFVGMALLKQTPIQYVLRIYVIILCGLAVTNELEWTLIIRGSELLTNWVSRGAVYAFIGVLGLEENTVSPLRNESILTTWKMELTYMVVASYMMVGCGILYSGMGLICMQRVCNRYREDYKKRCELAKAAGRISLA